MIFPNPIRIRELLDLCMYVPDVVAVGAVRGGMLALRIRLRRGVGCVRGWVGVGGVVSVCLCYMLSIVPVYYI